MCRINLDHVYNGTNNVGEACLVDIFPSNGTYMGIESELTSPMVHEIKMIEIDQESYPIPANPEYVLESMYGPDYMTPDVEDRENLCEH